MYVKGVGMTKFGISDKFSHQMAYEATLEALNDADMKFDEIDDKDYQKVESLIRFKF